MSGGFFGGFFFLDIVWYLLSRVFRLGWCGYGDFVFFVFFLIEFCVEG